METTLTKPANWLKLLAGVIGIGFERIKPAVHHGQTMVDIPMAAAQDDLTLIHGIGPTFAQRLRDAGITTYAQIAGMTPEELQTITKAAIWQANPTEWVVQAQQMSSPATTA